MNTYKEQAIGQIEADYNPFDHGTQTHQVGDKFFREDEEVLLSDSEKFVPNGATELNGDSAEDFGDATELKDEDQIPY